MRVDDRFDDLVSSLGGFYRTWYVYVGLELGLFQRLRDAGSNGLTADELAQRTGTEPRLVHDWSWGADAHDLVAIDAGRITMPEDIAVVLLDADRSEYLGGQYLHAAIGSLDYAHLLEVFRSGTPVEGRPDRYRAAIERLTVQDIAVFFQELLASVPELVVGCGRAPGSSTSTAAAVAGSSRWRAGSPARSWSAWSSSRTRSRAPGPTSPRPSSPSGSRSSGATWRRSVTPGVRSRLLPVRAPPARRCAAALRSAWEALAPDGWLVTLDWYMPSEPEELRSRHGELIAGVQLDELVQGTRLVSRNEALAWFAAAEIPTPELIDLPSGASAIIARR